MACWWRWAWLLLALATACFGKTPEFVSATLINNVVADPRTGFLYVGAVNSLHQMSPDLQVLSRADTGPKRDNRLCTPPVTEACEEAVETDNHNKLLLVHPARNTLVVCGSVFRGICSLRNLSSVEDVIYYSDTNGEKSYVASTEEGVSVVGVMSFYQKQKDGNNLAVFLVRGRPAPTLGHVMLCFLQPRLRSAFTSSFVPGWKRLRQPRQHQADLHPHPPGPRRLGGF